MPTARRPNSARTLFASALSALRASLAGGAATLSDLAVLFILTAGFGLTPRIASIPALLVGGTVNFFANRHYAFRAAAGNLGQQLVLYIIVEAFALGLNGLLYDNLLRAVPLAAQHYAVVRVLAGSVVFVLWSYPLWRRIFHIPQPRTAA